MARINVIDKLKEMTSEDIKMQRNVHLAENVVICDGQDGCGKTLFSPIIASFDRVELLTYAYELEHICTLTYLKKMKFDAAETMVRMLTDLQLYNTMMGRELNFRPADLSSIFKDINPYRYLKRIMMKGDQAVPDRVKEEKPILHLTIHNLLSYAEPVFAGLNDRLTYIEIVRHPLYMIKQQIFNMQTVLSGPRDFRLYYDYKGNEVPYIAYGWEELFLQSNECEKAIYAIKSFTERTELAKKKFKEKYKSNLITIPFERYVLDPMPYMEQIKDAIGSEITSATRRMMKKQKVPRAMYAEGLNSKVYQRYGFELPEKDATENDEFAKRWNIAAETASAEALKELNKLCQDYEDMYLGGAKDYAKKNLS